MSDFPYPILYQSPRLIVIDKPAGLPVHPGPKTTHSVEALFPLLSRRKDGPWLVHRLDADTSGCLMIALRKQALVEAQALFASGQVRKTYWAVVGKAPVENEGVIDTPLRKVATKEGWHMARHANGQKAVTAWRVLSRSQGRALMELTLLTGRTHQARVHCAVLGCPIIGDGRYGGGTGALHLMSRSLHATLTTEQVSARAEPSDTFRRTCHDFSLTLP
ncbi:RNA pseudouridine synthase [Asaia siamensis]|uniref:RNA pseudouridine synthase n=1 Tax=Asaia siamensis TaxID=110479 RepID=A0ABQ1MGB3_9PROT|nr:RNA pseudouridine synthase [Asaia siamensis]GBR03557.1 ribosomal RNA large subunit 23S rRNA pseudouridine synthase A [Asaia siamensis NRIC 0323]GGC38153.1 RNA pseudouridine synthase [Asaia siamensis]